LDVDELKRHINDEWAALSHSVIEGAVGEWRQSLRACVRAGNTCDPCDKINTVSRVCRYFS